MAERDKGQGFGFVYVDVKKLLDEARTRAAEARATTTDESATTPAPVTAPVQWPTPGAKVFNFNRDSDAQLLDAPKSTYASAMSLTPMPTQGSSAALKQIRQSLDRLQALHHKLHAVLAELSQATERERKK